MSNKNIIIAAAILAIGLIASAGVIILGAINVKEMDRTVTVRGLSEIEKPADHVIWPITYTVTGNELIDIFKQIEEKNQIILEFLNSNGIPQQEITINSPSVSDSQADRYYNGPQPAQRYLVTQVIITSSSNVDKVRELISMQLQLLKNDIAINTNNWQFQTKYSFNSLDKVKPTMIEEATQNARTAAEKFAEDSKSKIGKIKKASQGQLSIEDRDENTPYIKKLRVVTTVEFNLKN